MSMKPEFFCCIGAELKDEIAGSLKSSRIFMYRAAESQTIADMLVDGFFNEADDLRVNDLILLYCPEKQRAINYVKVSSVSGGVVKTATVNIDPQDIPVDTTGYSNISGSNLKQVLDSIDAEFSKYVKKDGSSIMTGPLKFIAGSYSGAIAGGLGDGIEIYKINSSGTIQTEVASITLTNGFIPGSTNTISVGSNALKWKNLYLAGTAYITKINNGYDLLVPAKSGTLATKEEVDLAANSGSQLYTTGVWYAKMYAATVVPTGAEYDGRNYADFSQVDSENNPVIKIYTGASGAWTLTDTITPPATYNGYMTITSKIWDIAEQSGQQGGQVLWDYTHKTFTPYPRIVSFESINITGNSTVTMPATPTDNNIPNKKYVDDAVSGAHYHPELLSHEWDDHERNDMNWVNALTFSWQNRADHQVAYDELASNISGKTLQSETISGTTVQFYLADNGRKICPAAQETNVSTIYSATGVAWYYIIDTDNDRFKLPRINPDLLKVGAKSADVVTNGETLKMTAGNQVDKNFVVTTWNLQGYKALAHLDGGSQPAEYASAEIKFASESGLYADLTTATGYFAGAKYLYFYVGSFTQTAIENTAGLNAELFNDKADIDLSNTPMATADYVVEWQNPSVDNNYTWYRKYKSGWVEQGGTASDRQGSVVLPVAMSDDNYMISQTLRLSGTAPGSAQICPYVKNVSSTGFDFYNNPSGTVVWQVSGMAAN